MQKRTNRISRNRPSHPKVKKHLKRTVTLVKMKVRKMKKIRLNPQKRRVKSTIETNLKVFTTAYFSYSS